MSYTQQLPKISELRRLVKLVGTFPASAQQIVNVAEQSGCGQNTIDFLCDFHSDEIFESSLDFITRCEEMELLIEQKRQSPKEVLHSSEG